MQKGWRRRWHARGQQLASAREIFRPTDRPTDQAPIVNQAFWLCSREIHRIFLDFVPKHGKMPAGQNFSVR
jgi:hypothetical protein